MIVTGNAKTRLYRFLCSYLKTQTELFGEFTAPEIQKNIEKYGVFVGDILTNNRLEWVFPNQKLTLNNWPKRIAGDYDKIKIVFENSELLVINKPTNLVVQSGAAHQKDNLLYFLSQKYGKEFWLIHRLDKDTSGILMLGKSEEIQKKYQEFFKNRETTKIYLAKVKGNCPSFEKIIHWQTRQVNQIRQRLFWIEEEAFKYDKESRKAITSIEPLSYCKELDQTLIQVQIFTGRMHQIRVVCEALGFSLVEDKIYNQEKQISKNLDTLEEVTAQQKIPELNQEEFEELCLTKFDTLGYSLKSSTLIVGDLKFKI